MKKLITAILLACSIITACDAPDAAEAVAFRENTIAEADSVETASKVLASCVTVEYGTTFTLSPQPIMVDGAQSFAVILESTAPYDQVDCIKTWLEANQP